MCAIFNPTAELVIPTKTGTNETNAEIETQPLTVEMKIKCSKQFTHFLCFSLFKLLRFLHFLHITFLLKDNILFHVSFLKYLYIILLFF